MAKKLPYIPIYIGDWLRDTAGCSLAAQGLWLRMNFLMHDSDRYGHLDLSPELIAARCGVAFEEYQERMIELEKHKVVRKTRAGVLFNERLVKDKRKRQLCSEAGVRGGGNPTFKGHPKRHPKGDLLTNTDNDNDISLLPKEESPRETKPRPRDPVFEVVQEIWFGGKVTGPHRGLANKITSSFKEIDGATPDEIKRRYGKMKAAWSEGISKTGMALVMNWHQFGAAPKLTIDAAKSEEHARATRLAYCRAELERARRANLPTLVEKMQSEIAALEAKQGVAV